MKFLALICAFGLYSVQGLKMRDDINQHEFLWWGNSDSSSNQNNRGVNGYNGYNQQYTHAKTRNSEAQHEWTHSSKNGGGRTISNVFSTSRTNHQQAQTQPTQGQTDQQGNTKKQQDDSSASSEHSSWLQGWQKYEQNGQTKRSKPRTNSWQQPQTQTQTTQPTLVNPIPIPPTSNSIWTPSQTHAKTDLRTHQWNSSVSSSSR